MSRRIANMTQKDKQGNAGWEYAFLRQSWRIIVNGVNQEAHRRQPKQIIDRCIEECGAVTHHLVECMSYCIGLLLCYTIPL